MRSDRQLLVDLSKIAQRDAGTGIQRVVREVFRHLLIRPPEGFSIKPVRAGRWLGYRHAPELCTRLAGVPSPVGSGGAIRPGPDDAFLALDLSASILPRHRRQLEQWKAAGTKLYFLVHDLLPIRHPDWFTPGAVKNFSAWLRCLAPIADAAICTSRHGAHELTVWLEESGVCVNEKPGVHWCHLGGQIERCGKEPALSASQLRSIANARSHPLVLMVGTLEPRKGYPQALSAFEILWARKLDINLVIAGRVGWKAEALVRRLRQHPEAGKRLFWFSGPPDTMLCELYRAASGVLMASHSEGFGLPLTEAVDFGKPVLVRDIPVFREIAGDSASYFAGDGAETLAGEIAAWISRIKAGAPCTTESRASTYSWAQCARCISHIISSPE